MSNIIKKQTMSSLEIAELTGKEHSKVMADIRRILDEAEIGHADFGGTYSTEQNKTLACFNLPRRECDLIIAGYSVKYRLAIIDRWQELELKQNSIPSKLDPTRLTKTNRALIALAKLNGLKGNQAILSADRATEKLEGHSPLKLLGIDLTSEVKERTLTPTDIGVQLGGVSAQGVNKILEQNGYQTKMQDGHGNSLWNPTEKGLLFGEFVDTQKRHSEGSPVKQWKWFMSIVNQIKSDSNDTRNGLVLLKGDKV